MAVYITIDGLSGAGKTVQAERVSEALGWQVRAIDSLKTFGEQIWSMAFGSGSDDKLSKFLYDLSLIRGYIDYTEEPFVFSDNFYRLIWTKYRDNLGTDKALSLFQQALPAPVASICLHVPAQERHLRQFRREAEGLYRIDDIKISTEMNRDEDDFMEFFRWLSERIPYIYVLDGTQSVESITDKIVEIVHDNCDT